MTEMLEGAVRRPDAPNHLFVLRPVDRTVTVRLRDREIAHSDKASWLLEAGKTLYAPVIYMPRQDVEIGLATVPETTHCPLKGDATYFIEEGDGRIRKIAWSYQDPLPFSESIRGLIAFDPAVVTFDITPS